MVEIEKNIPLPVDATKTKYPWRTMEVGDSFRSEKAIKTVSAMASKAGKEHKRKFVCRTIPGTSTVRVWRIE